MYCVWIGDEVVYAASDKRRFMVVVGKKYANISNARLLMQDGTPIKFN